MKSAPNESSGRLLNLSKGTFWDWNLKDCELTTSTGKTGKNGRQTSRSHASCDKARKDLERKHYRKLREGFVLLGTDNPGPICVQTWLTREYTGFCAFDIEQNTNRIAAGRHTGQGGRACELVLMDAATGEIVQSIELSEFDLSSARFYGNHCMIQADDRVMKLNIDDGVKTTIGSGGVFPHLVFDLQAGRLLLSRHGPSGPVIVVIELSTGEVLLEIDASAQKHVTDHHVSHVGALSPSGRLAAICRQLGEIELYDLSKGTRTSLHGDFGCVTKLQFHPSDRWLGLTEMYGDWRFRLWSVAKCKEDTRFDALEYLYQDGSNRGSQECFDFSFDQAGEILALRDREWIRFHDFNTQETVMRIEQRHVARSIGTSGFRLRYAPDGRIVTRTDCGVITVYQGIDENMGNDSTREDAAEKAADSQRCR